MYGVKGSIEACVVVGMRPGIHDTHISTTGLGSWLAQHFQWHSGRKNNYVPIMQAKSHATLVIFIAHVASRRISTDAEDGFNGETDIGSQAAAFATEAMRVSFERLIRQFAKNLRDQTRDDVMARNSECMGRFGFSPRYDVKDKLPYSGGNKMAYAASCLIQVINLNAARVYYRSCSDRRPQARDGDAYGNLLNALRGITSTYPDSRLEYFTTEDKPVDRDVTSYSVHALFSFREPVTLFSEQNSFYSRLRVATKPLKRVGLFSVAPVDFCRSVAPNNTLALAILAGHYPKPSRDRDHLWNSWHAPPPTLSLPGSRLPTPPPPGAGREAAVLDARQPPPHPVLVEFWAAPDSRLLAQPVPVLDPRRPPFQPVLDPRQPPSQPVLDPRRAPSQLVIDPRLGQRQAPPQPVLHLRLERGPPPPQPVLDPRPPSPDPPPTTFSREFTPQSPSMVLAPSLATDRSPSPVSLTWERHSNKPASQALAELLTEGFFRMDVGAWRPGQTMPDQWLTGAVLKKPTWLFQVLDRAVSAPTCFDKVASVTLQNAILDLLRVFCGPMADGWIYLKEASMELVDALRHNENTFPFIENRFQAFNDTCRAVLPVVRAFTTISVESTEEFKGIGVKRGFKTAVTPPSKAPRLSFSTPQIIFSMPEGNKVRRVYTTLVSMNDLLHAMHPDSFCMVDWDYLVQATEELQRLADEGAKLCGELIAMSPDH
jgi:hypothetical protein